MDLTFRRQTDLFVEDVQCNSVLWFAEPKRGRGGEFLDRVTRPRIVSVVDVSVPYPLLRAVFRAFPGSELVASVWDDVMPPPVEKDDWLYSAENTLVNPRFEAERQSKRAAAIPDTRFVGEEGTKFWAFALEVRIGESAEHRLTASLRQPHEPNLAKIVVDTDLTNHARKRYDVAKWRLCMARHYSKLFGAYAMAFQLMDMREATLSERMAKAIFDDVVAKRVHRRPRSYGWYVIKRYWLPVWTLRNWLWKVSVARKYAPGASGYLQDLEEVQDCYEFVCDDDGMTIVADDGDEGMVDADPILTQLDCEFDRIIGKRRRVGEVGGCPNQSDWVVSDSEFE